MQWINRYLGIRGPQPAPVEAGRYCLKCRYSLTGLVVHRCPECGRGFDPDNSYTYALTPKPTAAEFFDQRPYLGPILWALPMWGTGQLLWRLVGGWVFLLYPIWMFLLVSLVLRAMDPYGQRGFRWHWLLGCGIGLAIGVWELTLGLIVGFAIGTLAGALRYCWWQIKAF